MCCVAFKDILFYNNNSYKQIHTYIYVYLMCIKYCFKPIKCDIVLFGCIRVIFQEPYIPQFIRYPYLVTSTIKVRAVFIFQKIIHVWYYKIKIRIAFNLYQNFSVKNCLLDVCLNENDTCIILRLI